MGWVKKSSTSKLSKKQLNVIEDIFWGNLDETEVIKKHKVSNRVYRKWLGDANFIDELAFRLDSAKRQSNMIIAKFAPAAAFKLVELTDSEKEETSRKACLDIMAHPSTVNSPQEKKESVCENISSEKAEKILAVLAKEDRKE